MYLLSRAVYWLFLLPVSLSLFLLMPVLICLIGLFFAAEEWVERERVKRRQNLL